MTNSYKVLIYVGPDQFVSSDVCLCQGCQGVSLVARECSRGFGDESEPKHGLWESVVKLLDKAVMFIYWEHKEIGFDNIKCVKIRVNMEQIGVCICLGISS